MSFILAAWASVPPLWKMVGIGSVVGLIIVLLYVYCSPPLSESEKALEAQNAALQKQAADAKVAADTAKADADAAASRAADAEARVAELEQQVAVLHERRAVIRRAGKARADEIGQLPAEQLHDRLLSELSAAEKAMKETP